MDEEAMGREQARQTLRVLRRAQIGIGEVWLYYFGIGGDAGELEVDAYLHHALQLPRLQRDILAHAANEIIGNNPHFRAPYAADLVDSDGYEVESDG